MRAKLVWAAALALLNAYRDDASPVASGVRPLGRAQSLGPAQLRFDWPGSGLVARFVGSGLSARLAKGRTPLRVTVAIDEDAPLSIELAPDEHGYTLAHGLALAEHAVRVERDVLAPGAAEWENCAWLAPEAAARRLALVGDSTSAGFGVLGQLGDADCHYRLSYGVHAARTLAAELTTIAASGREVTRNYVGEVGTTMLELYDRALCAEPTAAEQTDSADAVIVNLGANDINARKDDPGLAFEAAYRALLAELRRRHPHAFILCMLGPTLQGDTLQRMQRHIRRAIAEAHDRRMVWFAGISTQPPERYACAYHPNPSQHEHISRLLAAELAARLSRA